MDTFMDKLAQRLTAQEMIKANTTAETEEMEQLKNQIREYNACLAQLQKLIEEGNTKLENAKVDGREIERLAEAGVLKIQQMQQDTLVLDQTREELSTKLEQVNAQLSQNLEQMDQLLSQKLSQVTSQLETQAEQFGGKLDGVDENVHKECVKVYRNVQAVVVEESGKLTEQQERTFGKQKGKLNAILGVSIAALVLAAGSIALQLLAMSPFKLF